MTCLLVARPPQLARLAYKYRTLARLRRTHGRGMPEAPSEELRALAQEFPGALNELDTMPLEEIEARSQELERVHAQNGEPSRWMLYVAAYHEALKLAFRSRGAAAQMDAADSELPVDAEFLQGLKLRPGGRVVPVVFAALARWSGDDQGVIEAVILPRRRRKRSPG